jgi:hypothetical protein
MDKSHLSTINYDDLLVLLGKSSESKEYHAFAQRVVETPHVDNLDFATYFFYETLGFHIRYDNEKQVFTGVTIWNANLRYSKFQGSLPSSISFTDDQGTVTKKLGQPLQSGTSQGLNFPPEPIDFTDRDAAYDKWVLELKKQPVSSLEWAIYKFGSYDLKLNFDMSKDGTIRSIEMGEIS